MNCPSCGQENRETARFCDNCASPLVARAPRDPRSYTPEHLADKILQSKSALEGERKQVTVLFADLKGSMELLADRDPEEARALLDPVLERMMEAVHRYEGTVNQVMGDGIMALFGAPLAHEDHAVRACYAALAIQDSIRRYTEDTRRALGIEVQVRVGLNSGEVVVRAIGSDLQMDYTAVGQTTHLAARMEQLAPPGSIRLTAETLRLAEGFVQAEPLGPVPVKGLEAPIEVYEVTGAGPVRRRLEAAVARGLTRFVGRNAELDHLRNALEHASGGHGQVVALVGEPGVGKSRLTWELTHSHRTHEWLVLESSSVSYGKTTPYLPVIDLLKGYFRIQDRDDQREIRDKVIGRLFGLNRALEPTLPAFFALLDLPVEDPQWHSLDPMQRRQQTLEGVKQLLLRESQVRPLLVVMEDLHWIDSETQALLDGLIESLPSARLLLLVNYRPEYEHHWDSKPYYAQLRLDPLPPESAAELLQALLGTDESVRPLKPFLIERTEGNPFFLEESVRTLAEAQALVGDRGAYRLLKSLDDIQVPATVQAILAARIDRLPPEDKRLLQAASVIGKDVPFAVLQAVAELPEAALRQALTRLQAAEFLDETSFFPELVYTFTHGLTHDVAYGSLLQKQRRTLHARILEALEVRAGDGPTRHVDRFAHHAVRGEVWNKAVGYLREAVASTIARSAHREAVGYVEEALMALEHLPDSREKLEQAVDLRFELRVALWPLGTMARILKELHEAEAMAETLGDRRRMALASLYLCTSFYGTAEHDRAVAAGERALAHSRSDGAIDLQILAGSNLGQALVARTDYLRATQVLDETLTLLEEPLLRERFGQGSLPAVLARVNQVRGLVELGRFDEAIVRGEEAVQIAQDVEHPASLLLAYWACGLPRLRQGDTARAIVSLERSLHIHREVGLPIFLHWFGPPLGAAYALVGRVNEALTFLEQILEQDASMNVMSQNTLTITYLAEAHLLAGHIGDATDHAERALALARGRHERGYQAWIHRLLGEVAEESAERIRARACYQKALALADELGMRPLAAHCHLGLGRLQRRTADHPVTRERLSRAATMYRDMDMSFWLEQAEAELATSDGASGEEIR